MKHRPYYQPEACPVMVAIPDAFCLIRDHLALVIQGRFEADGSWPTRIIVSRKVFLKWRHQITIPGIDLAADAALDDTRAALIYPETAPDALPY